MSQTNQYFLKKIEKKTKKHMHNTYMISMSNLSNYNKVVEFNKTFGVKIYDKVDSSIFDKDSKLIQYRVSLIKEECRELVDAVNNNDVVETVDALLDILYVVYGMGCSLGYDMDSRFFDLYCEFNDDTPVELAKEMTNYEKVLDYCKKISMVFPSTTREVFANPIIIRDYYLKNIQDDLAELVLWVEKKNIDEVIYALTQMLFTAYAMGTTLGINMDHGFSLVHDSNMSKVCKTEDIARATVQYYKDAFHEGKEPYDTPNYRLSDDGQYYIVFNESTCKILKSIEYHIVDLKELIEE